MKSLKLAGYMLAVIGLAACVAEPQATNPSVNEDGCETICLEQGGFDFQVATIATESLLAFHAPGTLTSSHDRVVIEPLSATASQIRYTTLNHKRDFGLYQDEIPLVLVANDAIQIATRKLPVKYEWYRAFNVVIPETLSPAITISAPADVLASEAREAGIIKKDWREPPRILGTYSDWEITDIPAALNVQPTHGQGEGTITVSIADQYRIPLGKQLHWFTVKDKHSGESRNIFVSIEGHANALSLSETYFNTAITEQTTRQDLVWTFDIADATAGLLPERQVSWEFIDIPSGFTVTPVDGHSRERTQVIIKHEGRVSFDRFGTNDFTIQLTDQQGEIINDSPSVRVDLLTDLPLIKNISPLTINTSASSKVLMVVENSDQPFELKANGRPIASTVIGEYLRVDDLLDVGQVEFSIAPTNTQVIENRLAINVVADEVYPEAAQDLGVSIKKLVYQASSQSLVALTIDNALTALKATAGSWQLMNCDASQALIDIEVGYDDVLALSPRSIFGVHIDESSCNLSAVTRSATIKNFSDEEPDSLLDYTGIALTPVGHSLYGRGDLAMTLATDEGFYLTYMWPLHFSDGLRVDFKYEPSNSPQEFLMSANRFVAVSSNNRALESEPQFSSASLSDEGDRVVFPSGNIYRSFDGEFSVVGQINQPTGDFGVKNVMASDGRRVWRVHYDGESLWLREYHLIERDNQLVIEQGVRTNLELPDNFAWKAGDFVDVKSLPGTKVLALAMGQWLWAVGITRE